MTQPDERFDSADRQGRRPLGLSVTLFAAAILLGFGETCRADTLSLPLQGYFHPGRAMPVAWEIARPTSIEVWAEGAARSRIASGNTRGVFPFLTFDRDLGEIHWRIGGAVGQPPAWTLHPLDDSQHLVAMEGDDSDVSQQLFSSGSVVPIVVDSSAMQGSEMAWEALDGLLLRPQSFARLSPEFCRGLLAAGLTLAVTGDARPQGPWPWRKGSGLWMVSSQLPLPSISNGDVFDPAQGWAGGRSGFFRGRIVLLGALFCLAACGVGLWRSGLMPAALVLLCVAVMAVSYWDNRRQSPVISVAGTVRLVGLPMPISDVWFYQNSHRDCAFKVPVAGVVQPFAMDGAQLRMGQLTLVCDGSGAPIGLEGFLQADSPFCLMSRRIDSPGDNGALSDRITSPLRLLGRGTIYPEFMVSGQVSQSGGETGWPTVVMRVRE